MSGMWDGADKSSRSSPVDCCVLQSSGEGQLATRDVLRLVFNPNGSYIQVMPGSEMTRPSTTLR